VIVNRNAIRSNDETTRADSGAADR
jgi:hypothetical protein